MTHQARICLVTFGLLLHIAGSQAQETEEEHSRLHQLIPEKRHVILGATINDGFTPLWQAANQYGLTGIKGSGADLQVGIFRDSHRDSLRQWRIGYGLDVIGGFENEGFEFLPHQIYIDIAYRRLQLTVGSKEQGAALKDAELSTGSQTLGTNAAPAPAIRLEMPDYWQIHPIIGIKGHLSYGWMTDGRWQRDYVISGTRYATHVRLHTKSLYLRLGGNGNPFPLSLEAGLETACLFGGNIHHPVGIDDNLIKMPSGFKDYFKALYGGGKDITDGDYPNAQGNTVGSWLLSLNYQNSDNWKFRTYYDHFFEDHSQAFFQYGWRDGLIGFELSLPKNKLVSRIVYEYMRTTHQSGPIYHDHTTDIPIQISAGDNYYNHNLYQGWQHWGMSMGNALFTSPLYDDDGNLEFKGNRFTAHHLGVHGDPIPGLHYRMLYTHIRNLGSYNIPYPLPKHNDSFLLEASYAPPRLAGYEMTASVAFDRGNLIGNNNGITLAFTKHF